MFYFLSLNMLNNNQNWTPPSSIEEKIKKFLIPGKLYLNHLKRKHLKKGEDELHLLRFFVHKGNGAIDIGANKGVYSSILAPLTSIVHAFEPNPKLFRILKSGLASNCIGYQIALSNTSTKKKLLIPYSKRRKAYSNQGASLSNVKVNGEHGVVEVQTRTLDSYNFINIDFIKIDVEGHELNVLKGAVKTLKRNKPILLVELSESHTKMPIEELIKNVESYGFKAMFLKKGRLHDISLFNNEKDHRYAPIGKGNFIYNFIFFPDK